MFDMFFGPVSWILGHGRSLGIFLPSGVSRFQDFADFLSRTRGERGNLTARNVQTRISLAEVTNRWHFLHAPLRMRRSHLRLNLIILRFSLDVQLEIDLSLGFFHRGGGDRGTRRTFTTTVHTVVVIVLAIHHGMVWVPMNHGLMWVKGLGHGPSLVLVVKIGWVHLGHAPRILPGGGQIRGAFQCRHVLYSITSWPAQLLIAHVHMSVRFCVWGTTAGNVPDVTKNPRLSAH